MSHWPLLSLLIGLPLVGGIGIAFLSAKRAILARRLAFVGSLGIFGFALLLWAGFDSSAGALQFVERHEWVPSLGVQYFLGLDGLGLIMVLLTSILVPMAVLASARVGGRAPLYFGLMLMLEAGVLGTFLALNFFHWFLFWELSLIPAFFLVRFWGGARRVEAATQFFVYTMVGSIALLLAFLGLFLGARNFNFPDLAGLAASGELRSLIAAGWGVSAGQAGTILLILFAGVLLGFAVKVPLVPFHGWLPLTYSEAPTGVVMLLTGLMSKMGLYGIVRILLPIFPDQLQQWQGWLVWLAVFSIVFSAGAAFAQQDLKRLLAFSSIGHLGFCLLAVFSLGSVPASLEPPHAPAAALTGVLLQMFNHGLTAATLFWFAGVLEERCGTRRLPDLGGLRAVAPVLCGLMGIAIFASLGLPGLNGFVSEFLILKGAFPLVPWPVAAALVGLLITAVYLLTLLQRVFYGALPERLKAIPDLTFSERVTFAAPVFVMLLLGVWPQLLLGPIHGTVTAMVAFLSK